MYACAPGISPANFVSSYRRVASTITTYRPLPPSLRRPGSMPRPTWVTLGSASASLSESTTCDTPAATANRLRTALQRPGSGGQADLDTLARLRRRQARVRLLARARLRQLVEQRITLERPQLAGAPELGEVEAQLVDGVGVEFLGRPREQLGDQDFAGRRIEDDADADALGLAG